ncbi:MAG: type II/IV secretion system protein [Deltaproteobacteria bacterium]|nr:type II/IV secretion system protein [Deltaproteobacteria bacterium]
MTINTKPIRIGELLKEKGVITDKHLDIALAQQKITSELLGDTLIKLGFVSSMGIAEILAEQAGLEFLDINEYVIPDDTLKLIPRDVAEKSGFIPLSINKDILSIGVGNPSNILAVDVVTKLIKKPPRVYIIDGAIIGDVVERSYFFFENRIQKQIEDIIANIKSAGAADGDYVNRLTDLIIMDSIRRHVTDMHINPAEDVVHVMYRIDGVMQYGYCLPKAVQNGITSMIKILSQLDIAEQRLPQDGSFTYSAFKKTYDMRVSTVPAMYGENVVIRILSGATSFLNISTLGFYTPDVKRIKSLFNKHHGIILIVGPTGSGKTTTLYAALREVNLLEKNILTVEDPVEYKLPFVKQTQVNIKAGYDFALAGRSFMRQDPDVMLLGEIRDEETAKIAIRASITGHLVLSTLHSNDAVTSIPRLLDFNVDKFMLSASLLAVMAQRLIRKICKFCKYEYPLSEEEMNIFKEFGFSVHKAFKGKGCGKCNRIGYAGRAVIGEILVVDDEIRELIYSAASINTVRDAAVKKGMKPFKADALRKAAEGITTLEEVLRVVG